MSTRVQRFKWVGDGDPDGGWFPGIPTRDLEMDDVANLTPEQYQDVKGSRLYTAMGEPPKDPEKSDDAKGKAADGGKPAETKAP